MLKSVLLVGSVLLSSVAFAEGKVYGTDECHGSRTDNHYCYCNEFDTLIRVEVHNGEIGSEKMLYGYNNPQQCREELIIHPACN